MTSWEPVEPGRLRKLYLHLRELIFGKRDDTFYIPGDWCEAEWVRQSFLIVGFDPDHKNADGSTGAYLIQT
jgi:hypothetical protein